MHAPSLYCLGRIDLYICRFIFIVAINCGSLMEIISIGCQCSLLKMTIVIEAILNLATTQYGENMNTCNMGFVVSCDFLNPMYRGCGEAILM